MTLPSFDDEEPAEVRAVIARRNRVELERLAEED